MHSNRLFILLVTLGGISLGLISNALAQDTLSTVRDSIVQPLPEKGAPSYKNLVYVSGVGATSTNDGFYHHYFNRGFGAQLGIPLYSHTRYTIRFNVGYMFYAFDKSEYTKFDTTSQGKGVSGTRLETVSFLPDVMIHPFPNLLVSPYLSMGVGVMLGSKDPSVTLTSADGKDTKTTYPFGTRYLGQIGAGGIVQISPSFNVIVGASYSMEFLQNHQPEDVFYKFKTEDVSYKFINYSIGVQFKFKQE